MKKIKVKILNEFGSPLNLKAVQSLIFKFPYMGNRILEKRNATVIDADEAIVEIEFDEFDVEGMNEGIGQNFKAEVKIGGIEHIVLFAKGLNIEIKNGRKQIK